MFLPPLSFLFPPALIGFILLQSFNTMNQAEVDDIVSLQKNSPLNQDLEMYTIKVEIDLW